MIFINIFFILVFSINSLNLKNKKKKQNIKKKHNITNKKLIKKKYI